MSVDLYVALLVSILIISGCLIYIKDIVKGLATPTKSSWIIFSLVTGLNVSSFLAAKFDLISGAAGIADLFSATLTLLVALIYGRHQKVSWQKFEGYYLIGATVCLGFWLISKNPFATNLLVQLLLSLGYIPTIHNIVKAKRSTESKLAWTIWWICSLLSLYPAIAQQNFLAIIYSLRALILGGCILILTYKYSATKKEKT